MSLTPDELREEFVDAEKRGPLRSHEKNEALPERSGEPRRTARRAPTHSTQTNNAKRTADVKFPVEAILKHKSVADLLVELRKKDSELKCQITQLRTVSPLRTAFLVRWQGHAETGRNPTWELDEALAGVIVYEEYCAKHCPGLQRYFLSVPHKMLHNTMTWLNGKRKSVTFSHALLDTSPRVNYPLRNGNEADDVDWKVVYMLVDAHMLPLASADCDLRRFASAIFYIGKGTRTRPFEYLEKAKKALLKANAFVTTPSGTCAERIAGVWLTGGNILVLPVVAKLRDDESKKREAALISLKSAGLQNLTNKVDGVYKGHEHWTQTQKVELGVLELQRAFECYKRNRMLALGPQDIPLSPRNVTAWHAVCLGGSANERTVDVANDNGNIPETSSVTANKAGDGARQNHCFVCKERCVEDAGGIVRCDECPRVYHSECHVPKIDERLPDDWKCSLCLHPEPLRSGAPNVFGDQARAACSKAILACFLCNHDAQLFLEEPAENNFRRVADRVSQKRYADPNEFVQDIRGILHALEAPRYAKPYAVAFVRHNFENAVATYLPAYMLR